MYWCLKCKKTTEHEHNLKQLKGTVGDPFKGMLKKSDAAEDMTDEQKKEYLDSLFEEYYNLDYEDTIGGGEVKTRFKYTKVSKEDFGLTEEEIFLLDDKQLNKLVSLKNYRTYQGMNDGELPEDDEEEGKEDGYKKKSKRNSKYDDKQQGPNIHRVIAMKK